MQITTAPSRKKQKTPFFRPLLVLTHVFKPGRVLFSSLRAVSSGFPAQDNPSRPLPLLPSASSPLARLLSPIVTRQLIGEFAPASRGPHLTTTVSELQVKKRKFLR